MTQRKWSGLRSKDDGVIYPTLCSVLFLNLEKGKGKEFRSAPLGMVCRDVMSTAKWS